MQLEHVSAARFTRALAAQPQTEHVHDMVDVVATV